MHDRDEETPRLARDLRRRGDTADIGDSAELGPVEEMVNSLVVRSEKMVRTHGEADVLLRQAIPKLSGTSATSFMHGTKRAPMLISVEDEGPIIQLNVGFVAIADPVS